MFKVINRTVQNNVQERKLVHSNNRRVPNKDRIYGEIWLEKNNCTCAIIQYSRVIG